jgi:hypothetical protein
METKMTPSAAQLHDNIAVLIPASLYNEFIVRTRSTASVQSLIEYAIENYLERTVPGGFGWSPGLWDESYEEDFFEGREEDEAIEQLVGAKTEGYQWKEVFLPNGTRLRFTFNSRQRIAQIRHGKVVYEGQPYRSPSAWVNDLTGQSRSAPRDIWIATPDKPFEFENAKHRFGRERSARSRGVGVSAAGIAGVAITKSEKK